MSVVIKDNILVTMTNDYDYDKAIESVLKTRHPIYSTCSVGVVKIIVMVIIRKSKELAV